MPTFRSRSVLVDGASAALLLLGAVPVAPLPVAGRVALAIVFFLGIGRLSLRLARFLLPGEDRATTITATLVLAVAGWTVVATALGHFGSLTPRTVLLVAALALLTAAARPAPASPPTGVADSRDWTERVAVRVAFAIFAVSTALAMISERNAPPGAHGYDDTSYHLSAVATWYQWHDLRSLKFPVGDGSTTFYPIAGELFSLLLLLPLGGIDVLARWSEVPFALASLTALASLARLLSLGEGAAGVAVLLYAASPRVFPSGMLGAGNDHAMGFFVLASACGALLLRRGPAPRRAIFLGASLGLLIGTKYTGVMFLLPLLFMAGACVASALLETPAGDRRREVRRAGLGCLAGALTTLGVGGYTYLRNALGTGNPLFPATLGLGGHRLLQGWSGDTLAGFAARGRSEIRPLHFLWDRVDLFGPLFRWIVLPAAILAPLLAFAAWLASRARRGRPAHGPGVEAGAVVLLALPLILYSTFVRFMVDHRDIRYVLGGLALAGIALAWLLERLPPRAARLGRLGVILGALVTLVASRRAGRVAPAGADAAASYLDRAAPAGTTVAFCGGNQPYLFFGRRLQNRVLYVPTYGGPPTQAGLTQPLGASFFSWGGTLEFPRHRAVRGAWRDNLRLLDVGYVVVVRAGDELPERDWIAIEPDGFSRVYSNARTEVFSVRDTRTPPAHLRVDFDRPEADYLLLPGAWRRERRDGENRATVVVPPDGVDLMIPRLDAPASSVSLEGDGRDGLMPALRVALNGRILESADSDGRRQSFLVEASAWRPGRNRFSIGPATGGGDVRIAAIDLSLDTARPIKQGEPVDLPGNLDAPAEGSLIRGGVLAASGWCRERGGGRIDVVRFTIDGRDAATLRSTRSDRPDVVQVIPEIVEPKETGFAVDLDVGSLPAGDHNLVVEFETPDGRYRLFPPRRFRLVR